MGVFEWCLFVFGWGEMERTSCDVPKYEVIMVDLRIDLLFCVSVFGVCVLQR